MFETIRTYCVDTVENIGQDTDKESSLSERDP